MSITSFQIARGPKSTQVFGFVLTAVLLAIPLLALFFVLPHGPVRFVIQDGGLEILGDAYGRSFKQLDLQIDAVRHLDLSTASEFTLVKRTNGLGLPGYRAGWFETRSEGKALVFVSDLTKVVLIPTKLGYSILLSPEDPDQFIATLANPMHSALDSLLATEGNNGEGYPPGVGLLWVWLLIIPTITGIGIIWLCMRSRKVVFQLIEDNFRIKGDFYGRAIPRESLRVNEARLVNIKQEPDRLNLIRVNGIGMPGYLAGWCRSLNLKEKYLVFITDSTRVVMIPTRLGYTVVISPAAPELFLEALRCQETV